MPRKFNRFVSAVQQDHFVKVRNGIKSTLLVLLLAFIVSSMVSCTTSAPPAVEVPAESPEGKPDAPEPSEPETPSSNKVDYNSFSQALPTWRDFSPLLEARDEATGVATALGAETINDMVYECTVTPYSITQNPDEIVTFDPDSNILWVGALLQGQGYKDGIGSLAELPIRERAPITLSIDLLSSDNSRVVENPTVASVQQAIGELVEAATEAGLAAGSSISFTQKETHSVEQAALALGLSAQYMGFEVKSSLDANRSSDEKTITAYFVQKMFTVSMVLPSSPEDVFSNAFSQEILDTQVDLGNIGPTNVPVFVSNIVYGRILSFSFTSSASESDIKATLSATYEGVSGGGSAELSAEQKKVLQEAEIGVVTVGGEGKDALAIIRSGDLKSYFEEDAALTSAKPISYTVRNLGDNSIARVSETTDYNIKECSATPVRVDPIGAEFTVRFNHIAVTEPNNNCDPGTGAEIYYDFFIDNQKVASRSSSNRVNVRWGQRHTLDNATNAVPIKILNSETRTIALSYTVWEHDGGSADDKIAEQNISLSPTTRSGTATNRTTLNGCTVDVSLTVTKMDVYPEDVP